MTRLVKPSQQPVLARWVPPARDRPQVFNSGLKADVSGAREPQRCPHLRGVCEVIEPRYPNMRKPMFFM